MSAHGNAAVEKRWIVPLSNGSVNIAVVTIERKAGRDDTHHQVRRAVQGKRFSDYVSRRTKLATPEASAENHHRRGAQPILLGSECSAKDGLHTEGGKKVSGNHIAAQAFGFARAAEIVVLVPVNGHGRKSLIDPSPVEEIEVDNRPSVESRRFPINPHELLGPRILQWVEQHAVDDGKQRRAGADPERQSEYGDTAKARRFQEHPDGVEQVFGQCRHMVNSILRPIRALHRGGLRYRIQVQENGHEATKTRPRRSKRRRGFLNLRHRNGLCWDGCCSRATFIYGSESSRQSSTHRAQGHGATSLESFRQDSLPGGRDFRWRRQVSRTDEGVDGCSYARRQNRIPGKEGLVCRRRPGSVEGNQIRQWPDDHGHRPLKSLRAGGRRPCCGSGSEL